WLILLIVVLFTAFPPAFAALMTTLHAPLTLALVGIVLRGSAFVFRQYAGSGERVWGRVFAVAGTLTPLCLGAAIGAMTTGESWLSPVALAVGLFSLALFAMLAAVYLTVEHPTLADDFRARALGAALACAMLALVAAFLAPRPVVGWPSVIASGVTGGALLLA